MANDNKTQVLQEVKQIGQQMESFKKTLGENSAAYDALFKDLSYCRMKIALEEVVKGTEKYFRMDMNGDYPKVEKGDAAGIFSVYKELDVRIREFLQVIAGMEKKGNFANPQILSGVKGMTVFVQELVKKDVQALAELDFSKEVELPKLLMEKRARHIEIKELDKSVGEALSVRYPVSFTDKNGVEHKGYFTKDKREKSFREVLINAFQNTVKNDPFASGMPELQKYFEDVLKHIFDNNLDKDTDILKNYLTYLYQSAPKGVDSKYIKIFVLKLNQDQEFKVKINYKSLGIDISEGSSIPQRNSAMSAVANLLGIGDIIAHSENMTLKVGNENVSGVFMENAEGEDLSNVTKESPLYKAAHDCFMSDRVHYSVLTDIAKLQILDYICGNVDRHSGNMMYKLREGKIVGIQGIDNDMSFGTGTEQYIDKKTYESCLIKLADLNVIPKSLYNYVKNLGKETLELTLRGFGLSEQERNAAGLRLEQVQLAVRKKIISVEEDNKLTFEKMFPREDADGKPYFNLAWNLWNIKQNVENTESENRRKAKKKNAVFSKATVREEKKNYPSDHVQEEIKNKVDIVVSVGKDLFIKASAMKESDHEVHLGSLEFKAIAKAIAASKAAAEKLKDSVNRASGIPVVSFREYRESLEKIMKKVNAYMEWKPKTPEEMKKLKPQERKRINLAVDAYRQAKKLRDSVSRCDQECKLLTEELNRERIKAADELNTLSFREITDKHKELSRWVRNGGGTPGQKAQFEVLDELKKLGEKKFKKTGYGKDDYMHDVERTVIRNAERGRAMNVALA